MSKTVCGGRDPRLLWSMEEDIDLARQRVVSRQITTDDEILAEARRVLLYSDHPQDPALLALVIARLRYGEELARKSSPRFIMLPNGSVWSTYGTEGVLRCPPHKPQAPLLMDRMWLQNQRRFGLLAAWIEYDTENKTCTLATFEGAHDLETIHHVWTHGGDVTCSVPVSQEQTLMSYVVEMDPATVTLADLRLLRKFVTNAEMRVITGDHEWRAWEWLETPVKTKPNKTKPKDKTLWEREIVRSYTQGCILRKAVEGPALRGMKRLLGPDWKLIISRVRKEMMDACRVMCGGSVSGDHQKLLECMAELVNKSVELEQKDTR